ncbi:hypothetical protein EDD92_2406 [Streptomyces sp. TLI_185]|nr:hypothetical protein EDD92_2406 [Streptomyces sp. TLI_185]
MSVLRTPAWAGTTARGPLSTWQCPAHPRVGGELCHSLTSRFHNSARLRRQPLEGVIQA